jgi:hypothetical protein
MWLSTSLSALGLVACALAAVQDQTTTDENGIRSIPVCLPSYLYKGYVLMRSKYSCEHIPSTRLVGLQQTVHPLTSPLIETHSPIWIQTCRADGSTLEGIPLCAQISMRCTSCNKSWCTDIGIGTYALPQIDLHRKDGYSHGFP